MTHIPAAVTELQDQPSLDTTVLLSKDIPNQGIIRSLWKEVTGQSPDRFFEDLWKQPSSMVEYFKAIEQALSACFNDHGRPVQLLSIQREPDAPVFRLEYRT